MTSQGDPPLPALTPRATFCLVAFNVGLAVLLSATLVYFISQAPPSPPAETLPAAPADRQPAERRNVSQPPPADPAASPAVAASPTAQPLSSALVATLITMVIAGGAGGTLCNLRGLFRWMSETGSFPARFATPFYVRPFTGAMTGLFAFFVGHLLVTSFSGGPANSWRYLEGRLPYVGLAIVAGFAAQEFMERLKEVARTLFNPSAPRPEAPKAGD